MIPAAAFFCLNILSSPESSISIKNAEDIFQIFNPHKKF